MNSGLREPRPLSEFDVFARPLPEPVNHPAWARALDRSGIWEWLVRVGLWEIRDGDWYQNGHWTWNFRETRERRERQFRLLLAIPKVGR